MDFDFGIYTWYIQDTVDLRVVAAFEQVMDHHDLLAHTHISKEGLEGSPFSIHERHGNFIDHVLRSTHQEVYVFIDIDCLITNRQAFYDLCRFSFYQRSVAGIAHNVGHTDRAHHIYAGAPLVCISAASYKQLVRHSVDAERSAKPQATRHTDTCQNWSLLLEHLQVPYFCSYPLGFDGLPFGSFGHYGPMGRGVHYKECYHLLGASEDSWQPLKDSREPAIERFQEIAKAIVQGDPIAPRFKANDVSLFSLLTRS